MARSAFSSGLDQAGKEQEQAEWTEVKVRIEATLNPSILVRAIATERDSKAFKALFHYYAPRIKAMLMRAGAAGDVAEEIAQEALVAVWRKAESYDPGQATVSAWIFTIARNIRIDRARHDRRGSLHAIYDLLQPPESPSPELPLEVMDRERLVQRALDCLPDEQARVIELSFFHDCAHGEIAERLGIPLGTVKSRLRQAMIRLRDLLGESS